ncbi:MAG: DUF4058 family protein [Armatimonadetes bacterium]|nr:DUF4058 family protein [Armatimonadota bacterium]
MSSPFPGMDPYLEDPAIWPGVHDRLIVYIAEALQPLLMPRCYVDIRERVHPQRETFLEILAAHSREVVTVIEVISPSNRSAAGRGREEYRAKQDQVLDRSADLVEIGLLRGSNPAALAAVGGPRALPRFDYVVSIRRSGNRGHVEVSLVSICVRLPRIGVPLRPPDPDVVLDLPAVFTRSYDAGAYAARIDYNQPPPEPLRPDDAEWADALLKAAGLRRA